MHISVQMVCLNQFDWFALGFQIQNLNIAVLMHVHMLESRFTGAMFSLIASELTCWNRQIELTCVFSLIASELTHWNRWIEI